MSQFWAAYPDMQNELKKIQKIMEKTIRSSESFLDGSLEYMLAAGGKMIRPAFVLLGSKFGNAAAQSEKDAERIRYLAASVETLHLATLVHDDIIDESQLRRGRASIQSKYGKPYAVYMGDYLFTQCFMMLVDYDFSQENVKRLAKAMQKICVGEMIQYQRRFTIDKSTRNYLKVVSGKTAALFAVSLATGGYEGGADQKTARLLGHVGYNVGMAFQIIDDMLDYKSDHKTFGKDTRADILKGYYNLPIIRALATASKD